MRRKILNLASLLVIAVGTTDLLFAEPVVTRPHAATQYCCTGNGCSCCGNNAALCRKAGCACT